MESKTILWNGPLGVFEMESFAKGTIALGNFQLGFNCKRSLFFVGGGDSVAAVKQFGLEEKNICTWRCNVRNVEGNLICIAAILD
jgi:phosphoglycerate kinase